MTKGPAPRERLVATTRVLDIGVRKDRKVESVSTVIMDEVMAKLETILT
jgi:hypothetical protein